MLASLPVRTNQMNFLKHFVVKPNQKIKLADYDPSDTGDFTDKEEAQKLVAKNISRLDSLQNVLYAENKRAVLIVLQGMDTAGKDGAIRGVFSGVNPQACRVTSFKAPSSEESAHDFLWRIHHAVPGKGQIGVFNRSQYEDVLIVRVHNLVPKAVWSKRYEQINQFEEMLAENNVTILKFFLHISKDEQKKRLEERICDPEKNWKVNPRDLEERKRWSDYMAAYEDALSRCSKPAAPWFVIPSNKKWFRNLAISQIIVETMQGLKMKLPQPSAGVSKLVVK